jgi:PAS domain S-box-containing protein
MNNKFEKIKSFEIHNSELSIFDAIIEEGIEGSIILNLSNNKIFWIDNRFQRNINLNELDELEITDILSNNQIQSLINFYKKNVSESYFQISILNKYSNLLTFSSKIFKLSHTKNEKIKGKFVLLTLSQLIDSMENISDELKLLYNFEYFKTIIDSTNCGVSLIDKNGKTKYASEIASKILGYSNEELLEMSVSDIIDTEYQEYAFSKIMESLEKPGERVYGGVLKVKCKDGSYKYNDAVLINYLHHPKINAIIDIFFDVTEKHLVEFSNQNIVKELKERVKEQTCLFHISKLNIENNDLNHYLNEIKEIIPSGFRFPDKTFVNIIYNKKEYKSSGYKYSNNNLILTNKIKDIDVTICVHFIDEENLDDDIIFLNEENTLIKSILNIIILKISQLNTTSKLQESLNAYDYALSAVSDAIWSWDLVNNSLVWSIGIQTTFKHSKEDLNKLNNINSWSEFVYEDDREQVLNHMYDTINGKENYWESRYRFYKGNNELSFVLDKGYILRDENGKALKFYGTMQDITEQYEKEQEIIIHNRLLSVISDVNNKLLNYNDWYNVINECFEIIGKVANVDRVYYFECITDLDTNDMFLNQKLEWSAQDIEPQIENPELQNVPVDLVGDFFEPIMQNLPFIKIVREMKDSNTKEALVSQDIQSIVIFPLYVKGKFFGFIGFDECKYERIWKEYEVDFLKTIASSVSKAIESEIDKNNIVEQNNKTTAILNSIGDGFATIDNNSNVTYWNKKAEELTNIKSEYIVGKNVWDVFPSIVGSKYQTNVINANLKKFNFVQNKLYVAESNVWLEVNIYSTKEGISFYFRDISDKLQREEELEKLSYVAKNINDIVVITNKYKEIEWVNDAFCRVTNYSLEEVKGKKPAEFLQGENTSKEAILKIRNALNKKQSVNTRILNYSKNKEEYWLDISISPVFDENGQLKNFIAVEKVITDIVNYENNLKKINENLENIVVERTQELRIANTELTRLSQEKDRFFGIVAHDLKNPLTGIQLVTQLIEMKSKKLLGIEYLQFEKQFDDIYQLVKRITGNINELLEINKLERGNFNLNKTKTNLNDLFTEIITNFKLQAKDKNIDLAFNIEDANVMLDLSSVETISDNIISNAIKYSRINSKVEINVYLENNYLILKVKDAGPGFTNQDINNLYQPYKKLSAKPTGKESSSGLGLSIVKNIVEINGGTIDLQSELGVGSVFSVSIPI